jgi:hypothetical protein
MDGKYPHWYHDMGQMGPDECCEYEDRDMMCDYPMMSMPKMPKVTNFQESFKDRLNCLLGDCIMFSVCGPIGICKGRNTYCGTLCFIGCDFIIVNVNYRHRAVSMHIPICMLTFIAPKCSH